MRHSPFVMLRAVAALRQKLSLQMKSSVKRLAITACLIVTFSWLTGDTAAQITLQTSIGEAIDGLGKLAKTLEESGHSLLDHGNVVAGQQQLVLAGVLAGTISQLKDAYSSSLSKTIDGLELEQRNAFERLLMAAGTLGSLENKTSSDLENLVTQTRNSAHSLLDRIPLTNKDPIYFGMQTRDVLSSFDPSPDDIIVLGYHFVDSHLNWRKPEITVDDQPIDSKNVNPEFDRIRVNLPEELRTKLKMANVPCDPMKIFRVNARIFYTNGLFHTYHYVDFQRQALPGRRLYSFQAHVEGSRTANQLVPNSYSNTSNQVTFGCEETASASVSWVAPKGAEQINAQAQWVNTDNVKSHAQNAVPPAPGSLVATASGTITGYDRDCITILGARVCNCRGGGHGALQIYGTYMVTQSVTSPYVLDRATVSREKADITLPSESGLKLTKCLIQVFRTGCNVAIDSVEMPIPEDQQTIVSQNSTKGYFRATIQKAQLTLTATDLLP